MPQPLEIEPFDETGLGDRRALIDHLDYVLGPPGWFIDQIAEAIVLAADNLADAWIEIDGRKRQVFEVVKDYLLDELVETAKAGDFSPRRGERTWRLKPPRPGHLTESWDA